MGILFLCIIRLIAYNIYNSELGRPELHNIEFFIAITS